MPLHYVVHHAELDAGVVDLFEADDHPEQVRHYSSNLGIVPPLLDIRLKRIFPHQNAVVQLDHLLLQFLPQFQVLPNVKGRTVLGGPLVQEIAKVKSDVVELAEFEVEEVGLERSHKDVAHVAVVVAQYSL